MLFRRAAILILLAMVPQEGLAQRPDRPEIPVGAGRNPSITLLQPKAGRLVIRVRTQNGAPLTGEAIIRIFSSLTGLEKTVGVTSVGDAEIPSIPIGEYQLEVRAPGFRLFQDRVTVWTDESTNYAHVELMPESADSGKLAEPILLAPKARREMEKALAALEKNDLKEARSRLDRLARMAPAHPDVNYLLGILHLKLAEAEAARAYLEKTLRLQPNHVSAQLALGGLFYHQQDFAAAIPLLEEALATHPQNWEARWMLASAYFQQHKYEAAREQLEQALPASGEQRPLLLLLLARTHLALGRQEQARQQIERLLREYPQHAAAATARQLLETLEHTEPAAAVPVPLAVVKPERVAPMRPLMEPSRWAPPAIDELRPPTVPGATCPLREVLRGARRRASELVQHLERFTATEHVRFAQLDEFGGSRNPIEHRWEYLVTIRQVQPGRFSIEESRNPEASPSLWPSHLMTCGLAALGLVFHPFYLDDFHMECEGLSLGDGQPAWQIRFEQRRDRPARFRVFYTSNRRWPLLLKGRAWISANSFHVLRLETNLLEPVPEIGIQHEHLSIRYQPVRFHHRDVELWLPAEANFYIQYKGRRYHYQHRFREYLLFSVEIEHAPSLPSTEAGPGQPPATR
ncbi:MAG: tetratricopeptide repeat protein [Firmicutes bacterium]|nr:tetratricopeptide repeat protein [Bacillota bacterium]